MFKKLPIVFILTAATLWGTMGVFVRFLSSAGFTDAEKLLTRCVVCVHAFCKTGGISNSPA